MQHDDGHRRDLWFGIEKSPQSRHPPLITVVQMASREAKHESSKTAIPAAALQG